MRTKLVATAAVAWAALLLAPAAGAATFTVNSTDDTVSGVCDAVHCSLREAIIAANTTAGPDTILFALGPGTQTIRPTTRLDSLTDAGTVIDATPAGGGNPVVELDGSAELDETYGLEIAGEDITVRGLVINRFGFDGIRISEGAARARIEGNWLGLDATGTAAAPNRGYGVLIWNGATDNVVGGPEPADRNVISGNGSGTPVPFSGIGIFHTGTTGNQVRNNWIGLSAGGGAAVGNAFAGITVSDGPATTIADNVIAGNVQMGILLAGATSQVTFAGNAIGVDATGAARGNGGHGILVSASGSATVGPGNTIKHNSGAGVAVTGSGATVTIVENAIDANTGLGIDLGADGVTPNDGLGDPDTGPNGLQNFPDLEAATIGSGSIDITGSLSTTAAAADYRIDFYASATCDPSGNGEGARWLGSDTVRTSLDGLASIDSTLTAAVTSGEAITSTATAPDGSTSELSACVAATGGATGTFTVTSADNVVDGTCDAAHCSLAEAINAANAASGPNTITFAVGTGPITIQPALPLPIVSGPTVIDATTQPGYVDRPIVFVDGQNLGTLSVAFFVSGGSSTIRGFVLSRFRDGGILLNSNGNTVEDNYLGVDPTGKIDFGNGLDGIQLASADGNTIRRNVISGNNTRGISIYSGSDDNVVTGNLIGVGATGDDPIPNTGPGIDVQGTGNTIGGDGAAQNTIAHNTGDGIRVFDSTAVARIGANRIHDNGGLGIDLDADDGVTPNDPRDADTGPNGLQNFPELSSALVDAGSTRIAGTLSSAPGGSYRIDLYASTACDPSGNGEGARWLGTTTIATNADGVAPFDTGTSITATVAPGEAITATATGTGGTSEFSQCLTAGGSADPIQALDAPSQCPAVAAGGSVIRFEDDGGNPDLPASERYAFLGVRFFSGPVFEGPPLSIPVVRGDEARGTSTQSPPNSLFNAPIPSVTSAGVPLIIRFDRPQTAVGLYLAGSSDPTVTATLTALGTEDSELGSVSRTVTVSSVTTFFGLRATGDTTFGAVRIDYGASTVPEELDNLCFTATEPETGEPADIELTSDRRVLPVAAQLVPLSAVPSGQLPAFSGSPGTGPVGSIPIGSVPIGSVPIGSVPIGSVPIGSVPIGSVPIGSVPIGSVPIGSVGLAGVPIGSVGLDDIQLSSLPIDWSALLGTNVPIQTLTLADVYANTAWRNAFEGLTLQGSGLTQSILGSLTFPAILLGKATLSQIPPPGASSWCAAIQNAGGSCAGLNTSTNTVAGLGIAGVPIASVPIGSVPIGSVPIGSVPIGSVPIASVDLDAARLSPIRLSDITNVGNVADCTKVACATATLGQAKAAGALKPGATIADLAGAFGNITINDIIIGILPRSALNWESFPLDGLQLYAGTGDEVLYTLSFDVTCPLGTGFSATVRLPTGYIVKRGTTRVRFGTAVAVPGPDPATSSRAGARWTTLPGDPCAGAASEAIRRVAIDFKAVGGYELGVHTSSASVTQGGATHSADGQAPVTTRQNWESNDDPATAPTLAPNQLAIVHVASSGDEEVFRVAIPATAGTRTTFLLSHIEAGADFDLVVQQPSTTTLQSSPIASVPIASVPIEDQGNGLSNTGDAIPPETLHDIPIGSVPIGSVPIASVSANRGNADEAAEVVSSGETGVYTVTIRGYNGSHSDFPAVLRVKQTPPPELPACPARTFPNAAGTQGVLPASLPASTKTLFLLNRERLNRLYGQAATDAMRTQAQALLGRPEVAGALLELDGDAAVRTAYTAWDNAPCSPERANDVVRAINAVVARYRGSGLPNLRYVVILGTDEALPMARIGDPTTISNETDEAGDLAFTLGSPARGNALYAAAARAKFLSDAPYGALTQIPWLGRQLYLPDVGVGRVVETPLDIQRQLAQYVAAGGTLSAGTAFTTGYDFLSDGATEVDAQLTQLAGSANSSRLISDTWQRADVLSKFTAPSRIQSVNAHYNHWQLQPASGAALVGTPDLPAIAEGVEPAFQDRVQFTMGCHAGLNVADTLLSPVTPRMRDWAQAYGMQRNAVYVANTGFGYGDTVSNALSERLMGLFAKRLRENRPIGESWKTALADYFLGAGAYGVYDEKVLQEATFYGLPFWTVSGATPPAPVTPPALTPDPVSGLQVAAFSLSPGLTPHSTPRGRFWSGPSGTTDVHYRPIQPRLDSDVTPPAGSGLVAHGVIVKALATDDETDVDPATSLPTIDLSSHEPERDFRDTVFPASLVNLTRTRDRQWLVLNAGQYRPATPPGKTGIERLVLSASVEVAYSTSSDFSPPGIKLVGSTRSGTDATIFVETTEPVKRVAAMVNDMSSWRFVELDPVSGTNRSRWTKTITASVDVEVAAMAQDDAGNVGHSTNKGFNFMSVADTGGPEILIETPGQLQVFSLGAVARASYACSDPSGVVSCVGTVANGAPLDTSQIGTFSFTVNATDGGGRTASETREYVVRYGFSGFLPPVDAPPTLNAAQAGQTYPVKWELRNAAGAPIGSLASVQRITVTKIECGPRPEEPLPPTSGPGTSVSSLSYVNGQFVYTWKTDKAWAGTCRRLTIELDDGTAPYADFKFK